MHEVQHLQMLETPNRLSFYQEAFQNSATGSTICMHEIQHPQLLKTPIRPSCPSVEKGRVSTQLPNKQTNSDIYGSRTFLLLVDKSLYLLSNSIVSLFNSI